MICTNERMIWVCLHLSSASAHVSASSQSCLWSSSILLTSLSPTCTAFFLLCKPIITFTFFYHLHLLQRCELQRTAGSDTLHSSVPAGCETYRSNTFLQINSSHSLKASGGRSRSFTYLKVPIQKDKSTQLQPKVMHSKSSFSTEILSAL